MGPEKKGPVVRDDSEYIKMAKVEGRLWWYRVLHERVLSVLADFFPDKNISILDAGCGTGGLLKRLQREGYGPLHGFDSSETAVALTKQTIPNAAVLTIQDMASAYPAASFDCVICNDALYFLEETEQRRFIDAAFSLLKEEGILCLNVPALAAFQGTHDLSVGIDRRSCKAEMRSHLGKRFDILRCEYWPFLLSPLIFLVRGWQRMRLGLGLIDRATVKSDIDIPPHLLNELFYTLATWEQRFAPIASFGSSLFIAAKRGKRLADSVDVLVG